MFVRSSHAISYLERQMLSVFLALFPNVVTRLCTERGFKDDESRFLRIQDVLISCVSVNFFYQIRLSLSPSRVFFFLFFYTVRNGFVKSPSLSSLSDDIVMISDVCECFIMESSFIFISSLIQRSFEKTGRGRGAMFTKHTCHL